MKRWLATFSAVLAAGVAVLGLQEWRETRTEARAAARVAWERTAAKFVEDAAAVTAAKPDEQTAGVAGGLAAAGRRLIATEPAGVDAEPVTTRLQQLAHLEERLAVIDWPRARLWESQVRDVAVRLRAAIQEEGKSDMERVDALKAANEGLKVLNQSRPAGADIDVTQEPIAEIKRALAAMQR